MFFDWPFPIETTGIKVHYVELVNENPGNNKTMSVAEDILEIVFKMDGWY